MTVLQVQNHAALNTATKTNILFYFIKSALVNFCVVYTKADLVLLMVIFIYLLEMFIYEEDNSGVRNGVGMHFKLFFSFIY